MSRIKTFITDREQWNDYHHVPMLVVSYYLCFVFYAKYIRPKTASTAFREKLYFIWNLSLCLFSTVGATKMVPVLYRTLVDHGFYYSICLHDAFLPNVWTGLFILSKFPELIDTVFLVYLNKPVRFIHWFHHATVLLYCWHAYVNGIVSGLWFIAMNYTVHAVMYCYYAYPLKYKFIQVGITLMQIVQMIVGTGITISVMIYYYTDRPCITNPANFLSAVAMYTVYLGLFVHLFYKNYVAKHK